MESTILVTCIVIAIVGGAIKLLAPSLGPKILEWIKPRDDDGSGPKIKGKDTTRFMALWYLEQLDEYGEVAETFSIGNVGEEGITISRDNAKDGDIRLSTRVEAACTVSNLHAVIGMDKKGMFLQDNDSRHGTYSGLDKNGSLIPAEEIEIQDGTVVYLGEQAIRFVKRDFRKGAKPNPQSDAGVERKNPVRRRRT